MLPAIPADGRIEAFDLADALGNIRLVSGETVRFGRTACRFDPSAGLEVRVTGVEVGPLGRLRATRVELAGASDEAEDAVPQRTFLLVSPSQSTAWRLACVLATSSRAPHHARQLRAVETELSTARGKTAQDIAEMIALVRWAVAVINPINGRTAESNGTVHQLVADYDDLELALDIAQERHLVEPAELERLSEVFRRHLD